MVPLCWLYFSLVAPGQTIRHRQDFNTPTYQATGGRCQGYGLDPVGVIGTSEYDDGMPYKTTHIPYEDDVFSGVDVTSPSHCQPICNLHPKCTGFQYEVWTKVYGLQRVCRFYEQELKGGNGQKVENFECYQVTRATTPGPTAPMVETEADHVSSYGDPHSMNIRGQRFDIKRPGNHSFLVLPRGAEQEHANLHVQAHVTRRGGLCTGQIFITGLKLAGRWVRALGGDIELYAESSMFNSPEVVGLRLGNSSNISLEELVARIPKHKLGVSQSRPELPATLNTHVNTLMLQFQIGPSTLKVGWAHEKLNDGFANWLWLGVSGLGTTDEVGGLLGLDDHSSVEKVPDDVLSACRAHPQPEEGAPAAGLGKQPGLFRSWAFAEA